MGNDSYIFITIKCVVMNYSLHQKHGIHDYTIYTQFKLKLVTYVMIVTPNYMLIVFLTIGKMAMIVYHNGYFQWVVFWGNIFKLKVIIYIIYLLI
jgi:hypothetical protein